MALKHLPVLYLVCFLFTGTCEAQSIAEQQSISLTVQTGHSSSINRIRFSPNGKFLASAGSDSRILVWDIAAGKQLLTLAGHGARVNDISFSPNSENLASASDDGKIIIWNLVTGEQAKVFEFTGKVTGVGYSNDGVRLVVAGKKISIIDLNSSQVKDVHASSKDGYRAVVFSNGGELVAFGGKRHVTVIKSDNGSTVRNFALKVNQLAFSTDDNFLVGAGIAGNLKRWDLKNGSRPRKYSMTAERQWQSYLSASISDRYFAGGNKNKLISIYDLTTGRKKQVLNAHKGHVTALEFSPDSKILASAGIGKEIILWDTHDWEIIKIFKGTAEKVNAIEFADEGKSLIVGYSNGSFRYWQLEPGGEMIYNQGASLKGKKNSRKWGYTITDIRKIDGRTVELEGFKVKYSKRKETFKTANKYYYKWNLDKNSFSSKAIATTRKGEAKAFRRKVKEDSLLRSKNLFCQSESPYVQVSKSAPGVLAIKTSQQQPAFYLTTDHADKITSVKINQQKEYVATASWDGLIKLWDIKNGKLMINLLASNEHDYIFITAENNYFSSKGALGHIGFKVGSQIFSFDQFDLKYNRPDLVLEGLNYPDTAQIYAYRMAHVKRIQKSGVKSAQDISLTEIPEVLMTTPHKDASSQEKHIKLAIDADAGNSVIRTLHLSINGVPLYGNGLVINKSKIHDEIKIELSQGTNIIQCYVTSTDGVSSLQQTLQVAYRKGKVKPDLYLVTIGASNYKDQAFDLKYATKDAQDIAALFNSSKRFNEVKTLSLINENVTLESIDGINAFLKSAKVDDVVLITYSGHGLFDRNLDYFLSTHSIDFDNPEKGGLAYAAMEKILEGSVSRNKILIIDACHSGEIDKDEVELSASAIQTEEGEIRFRNVGPTIRNKSGQLKSSFELSKALFAESNTSHGAVVISSASGGEYAIEGKEWKNGVFTHCFIKALKKMKADQNKDGDVTVAELQRYLSREVYKMTGGRQTPTSRDENLSNNFIVW